MPKIRIAVDDDLELLDAQEAAEWKAYQRRSEQTNRKLNPTFFKETVTRMQNRVTCFDDLRKELTELFPILAERNKAYDHATPKLSDIHFSRSTYGPIPNTHFAPKNGVTNWGGFAKDRPTHYLGFHSIAILTLRGGLPNFELKKLFLDTGIHTRFSLLEVHGNGAGAQYIASIQAIIFMDDWPAWSQQLAVDRLTGDNPFLEAYYDKE